MAISIGIDIGSVSIKAAVIGTNDDREPVERLSQNKDYFSLDSRLNSSDYTIVLSKYRRIKGSPVDAVESMISAIVTALNIGKVYLAVTGSGGKLVETRYNVPTINEFSAIVETINLFYPDVRTVFEMGGESSKYIIIPFQ